MPVIKTLEDLQRIREEAVQQRQSKQEAGLILISVEMGTPSIAAGARQTFKAIQDYIESHQLANTVLRQIGDSGMDSWEPIVKVRVGSQPEVAYIKVTPLAAIRIMDEQVVGGKVVRDYLMEPV